MVVINLFLQLGLLEPSSSKDNPDMGQISVLWGRTPGQAGRCSECDRCDLYIVEDEEGTIRRAAVQAEKDWLEREGKSKDTDDKLGGVVDDVLASTTGGKRRDYDAWLDSLMALILE